MPKVALNFKNQLELLHPHVEVQYLLAYRLPDTTLTVLSKRKKIKSKKLSLICCGFVPPNNREIKRNTQQTRQLDLVAFSGRKFSPMFYQVTV